MTETHGQFVSVRWTQTDATKEQSKTNHIKLMGELKEQIWPVQCGRERERSVGREMTGSWRKAERDFGACKNENEGKGIGEKK